MKVIVPMHLTPAWIGGELSRELQEREKGRPVRKTKYVHPKTISIRQHIERAEQLKAKNESIQHN